MAIILAHPRSPVHLEPIPPDPREQAVMDPPHVRALRGDVEPDTCAACGHPLIDHVGGCALAIRQNRPMQTTYPMGVLYGDPHQDVTRAISHALETSCGPAMELLVNTLGPEDLLMVARQLSRTAVSAFLAELAK